MDVLYLEGYRITLNQNRNNFDISKEKIKSELVLLKEQSIKWLKTSKKFMKKSSISKYKNNYYKKFNEKIY